MTQTVKMKFLEVSFVFALLLSLTKTTPMSKLQKMKEDEKKPGRHYAFCAANAIATSSYFGKVLFCSKVANPHFAHLIQNSKASAKKLKGCLFFLNIWGIPKTAVLQLKPFFTRGKLLEFGRIWRN